MPYRPVPVATRLPWSTSAEHMMQQRRWRFAVTVEKIRCSHPYIPLASSVPFIPPFAEDDFHARTGATPGFADRETTVSLDCRVPLFQFLVDKRLGFVCPRSRLTAAACKHPTRSGRAAPTVNSSTSASNHLNFAAAPQIIECRRSQSRGRPPDLRNCEEPRPPRGPGEPCPEPTGVISTR